MLQHFIDDGFAGIFATKIIANFRLHNIVKVTTPNCNLFANPTSTDSCLKCTVFVHGSFGLIFDSSIFYNFQVL